MARLIPDATAAPFPNAPQPPPPPPYAPAATGTFFTLTNLGGGRYEGSQARSGSNPGNITVRSNFGGSASANLK